MNERYDVCFAGQILQGHDIAEVREKLATLFKADSTTLDALFSSKLSLIKHACDYETALRYQRAMEQAGAKPQIKIARKRPVDEKQRAANPTAAEKIAALAAAPDVQRKPQAAAIASHGASNVQYSGRCRDTMTLAPAGTAVLHDEERAAPSKAVINTSEFTISALGGRLSDAKPRPPLRRDTDRLVLAEPGAMLPNIKPVTAPLTPNLTGLSLAAAGTDFSDCSAEVAMAPALDLSALTLMD